MLHRIVRTKPCRYDSPAALRRLRLDRAAGRAAVKPRNEVRQHPRDGPSRRPFFRSSGEPVTAPAARPTPTKRASATTSPSLHRTIASRLAPRASRLAPRASRLAPRASRLAPRASRLAPRASRLAPRAPRPAPAPRAPRPAPRAPRPAPRAPRPAPRAPRPAPRAPRPAPRAPRPAPRAPRPAPRGSREGLLRRCICLFAWPVAEDGIRQPPRGPLSQRRAVVAGPLSGDRFLMVRPRLAVAFPAVGIIRNNRRLTRPADEAFEEIRRHRMPGGDQITERVIHLSRQVHRQDRRKPAVLLKQQFPGGCTRPRRPADHAVPPGSSIQMPWRRRPLGLCLHGRRGGLRDSPRVPCLRESCCWSCPRGRARIVGVVGPVALRVGRCGRVRRSSVRGHDGSPKCPTSDRRPAGGRPRKVSPVAVRVAG
ncbi:hypothetical protein C8E87_4431 [Paractinoplanes brasiliensis]|uniref:Uncharacterized protein n=1 Tax=Paractinoplanes brasiliensis TaxID=52695 RepID=A0A4R6JXS9_9ACTN|nr:hypothetical protein C8E87_4431 [Actinoplanes brasiliensis]